MDLLYASRQDHQLNTLIHFSTLFTSRLSTNHNNFQQYLDIHLQSTRPSTLSLIVSSSTNTRYKSSDNIGPYPEDNTNSSSKLEAILSMLQKTWINGYSQNRKKLISQMTTRISNKK